MEILDIAVKHYGKFENYRMAFRSGLNLICGGNETGKSTLHSFLGAMLFGLPRGRGRAARTDEYQLRQPWENPAYFAGEMRIREQGKLYRIRRDFSGHGPSLTILCETEEREEEEPEKFLEEMLGGIREAGFRNTIFVSQGSARTDRGLAGELESFMVNYENSLDERVDVSKALTSLRKKKKEFEQKKKKEEELLDARIEKGRVEAEYIRKERERLEKQLEGLEEDRDERDWEEEETLSGGGKAGNAAKALLAAGGMLSLAGAVFLEAWKARLFLGFSALVFFGCFYLAWRLLKAPAQEGRPLLREEGRWRKERLLEEIQNRGDAWQKLQEEQEALYGQYAALDRLQREADALDLAIQRICDLSLGIYQKTGGTLNDRASGILSVLTGGKYQRITMDDTMEVRVHTQDRILRLWQLSYGTMQQIYFSLRMAAGELFAGEKKLPLILDEPLAMYDDVRAKAALGWLEDCGRQVILFTSQSREETLVRELRKEKEKNG